jgi:hypothetical protein
MMKSHKIRPMPNIGVVYALRGNLGDLIQTLAQIEALRQLGITKYTFLDRENLHQYSDEPVYAIMGGWYMEYPSRFPPNQSITPIYTSFHVNRAELVLNNLDHFAQHAPIGCRDEYTVQLFKGCGIEAYLTKCLTLVFKRYQGLRWGTYLTSANRIKNLQFHGKGFPIYARTLMHGTGSYPKHPNVRLDPEIKKARKLLRQYRRARLVITSKLHCALPCRAFGTPVIFAHPEYRQNPRFSGLHEELMGSDGSVGYRELNPHINYDSIAQSQHYLMSDLRQRFQALGIID